VRRRERWEITLGFFVLLVAAVLVFLAVHMGGIGAEDRLTVEVLFDDAAGLVRDCDVTMAGVKIGSVAALDVEQGRALVTLHVRRSAGVRAEDTAAIRLRSLLGDKYIAIERGDPEAPLLRDGERLKHSSGPVELDRFLARLEPLIEELEPGAEQPRAPLTRTMERIERLSGMLIESLEGHEQELGEALGNLRRLAERLARSEGTDPEKFGAMVRELTAAMDSLDALLRRQRSNIDRLTENLSAISEPLAETAPSITANLDRLLAALAPAADDLAETSARIGELGDRLDGLLTRWEAITRNLEEGQGTAGKLLTDDTLYTETLELIRELRRHPWRLLRKKPPKKK
jgi:phospholipid/cholesterol/gamma-HCH transport system substrate-binding protein